MVKVSGCQASRLKPLNTEMGREKGLHYGIIITHYRYGEVRRGQ